MNDKVKQAGQGSNKSSGNSKNRNRNRYRNKNRNSNPNSANAKPGNFIVKYQNILEQYLSVRKKYFELFYRADPKQKNKLERNYENELKKLNDFEAKLNPKQKEELHLHVKGKNLDTIYSENHHDQLATYEVSVEEDLIFDPHYLESQQNNEWKEDSEESTGSIEDYQNYKSEI